MNPVDLSAVAIRVGSPDDLPDLSRLAPPGGNSRPDGIANCHFSRRSRGELPELY